MSRKSARIRYIRKALGQSQESFAVDLGIHRVTLAKVERGAEFGPDVEAAIDRYIAAYEEKMRRTA